MRSRLRYIAAIALVGVTACLVAACGSEEAATPEPTTPPLGDPLAPDLVFTPIADLQVGVGEKGERLLFFTAAIANLGDGPLLIEGTRDGDDWTLEQLVNYSERGQQGFPLPFSMIFGGDGHDHWHVEQAAEYKLTHLDAEADEEPRYDQKAGFCFFDQTVYREDLAGDVTEPQHFSGDCGHEDDETTSMGLSVGWADPYQWFLPGQSIDVTDAPDGRYRLELIVDPDGQMQETNTENNVTWLEFQLTTRGEDGLPLVEVLEASEPY